MSAKILKTARDSVYGVNPCSSGVPQLVASWCPLAVIRTVAAIVINALNSHPLRAFTHVCQEAFKTINPWLENQNPATAIILKLWDIGVQASGFHILPRPVRSCRRPTVTVLLFGAPTGRAVPANQILPACRNYFSALTLANVPSSSAVSIFKRFGLGDYFKPSKSLSDEGFSVSHKSVVLICATLRDRQVAGAFSL